MIEQLIDRVTLHCGDCLDVLKTLPDNSVDSCVTDPPYGLEFMGKKWDTFKQTDNAWATRDKSEDLTGKSSSPFLAAAVNKYQAGRPFQQWCEQWAREIYRVLKPGGHLLAFGGTRTYHRMACAIEDAGFEIRDCIQWIYGSGFPKSHDVSKGIDRAAGAEREIAGPKLSPDGKPFIERRPNNFVGEHEGWDRPWKHNREAVIRQASITAPATDAARQWEGWGTALKPANEPICLARKPLSEATVAANVLKWGVGCINIDKCRVPANNGAYEISDRESSKDFGGEAHCGWNRENDLSSLRQRNGSASLRGEAVEMAADVQPEMSGDQDEGSGQSPLEEGPLGMQSFGVSAPPGGHSERDRPRAVAESKSTSGLRTSVGDGAGYGSPADKDGNGASHQRQEAGQSAGKSLPIGLDKSRQGASKSDAGISGTAGGKQNSTSAAGPLNGRDGEASAERRYTDKGSTNFAATPGQRGGSSLGRWPSNVIHDGSEEVVAGFPDVHGAGVACENKWPRAENVNVYGKANEGMVGARFGDEGSAARFFYTAKADSDDRLGSKHPTVKPLDLMQYLVRLVTPKGGIVLDPFAGTGTTGEAAFREGMKAILIEREAEYQEDIRRRMKLAMAGPDERAREAIKARTKDKPVDAGPLFAP